MLRQKQIEKLTVRKGSSLSASECAECAEAVRSCTVRALTY